jgi:hypothetical protein
MKPDIEFIPYGGVSSRLTMGRWRRLSPHVRFSSHLESAGDEPRRIFLTFSHDLDQTLVKAFRKRATPASQLLIINEGASADSLFCKIVDLRIRTAQRFYVVESKSHFKKTNFPASLQALLERLVSASRADGGQDRILDAGIEKGVLHVVSPKFDRLDVPIAKLPDFENVKHAEIEKFEIDEDGSFIYWPDLDVHLGWPQLQQAENPAAALKASQKNGDFNQRYGKAVQKVREERGLKPGDISGLSEKQVGRIERGQCRLTANSISALAHAHKIERNEYMKKLAEAYDRQR